MNAAAKKTTPPKKSPTKAKKPSEPKVNVKAVKKPRLPNGAIVVNAYDNTPLGYMVPEKDDHFGTVYNLFIYKKDKTASPAGIATTENFASKSILAKYNKLHGTKLSRSMPFHKKNMIGTDSGLDVTCSA